MTGMLCGEEAVAFMLVQTIRWSDGWTVRALGHFKHTYSGYMMPGLV